MLDAVREAVQPIWSVYVLINKTKKEMYFGVSKRTYERITKEHANGETETISGWDWDNDKIVGDILYPELDRYSASRTAHDSEKLWKLLAPGYKVHQTAGI